MALFNITSLSGTSNDCQNIDFRASNVTVNSDTLLYKISELLILSCLTDFRTSNNVIYVSNNNIQISQLQL